MPRIKIAAETDETVFVETEVARLRGLDLETLRHAARPRPPGFVPGFRRWGRQDGAPSSEVQVETTRLQPDADRSQPVGAIGSITTSKPELPAQVAALANWMTHQLRAEWRRLYRSYPPRLSRDLLVRSIAYRMQELAYGGLSKATQRKLVALTKELETKGSIVSDPNPGIRPGARLVREWRGRAHTVVVTEDGFEYSGKSYSSLSQVAQAITGAHWSGPRFFGLKQRKAREPQSEHATGGGVEEGERVNG